MSRHNIWLRHSRSSEDKPSWLLFILFQEVATFSEFWRPWSLLAYRTSKSLLPSLFTKRFTTFQHFFYLETGTPSQNIWSDTLFWFRHAVDPPLSCPVSVLSPQRTHLLTCVLLFVAWQLVHVAADLCTQPVDDLVQGLGAGGVDADEELELVLVHARRTRLDVRQVDALVLRNHRQTCVDICLCFKALAYLNGCISWNMLREETSVNVFCCNRLRHRLCSTTGGCCVPTELMASYQRLWSPPRPRVRAVTLFSLCRLPQSQTDCTCIIKAFRTHCGGLVQKPSNKSSFPADI